MAGTPDSTRETWIFLSLGTNKRGGISPITDVELSFGNLHRLMRAEALSEKVNGGETVLLQELREELCPYRYDWPTLVVPTERSLRHLRSRLIATEENRTASLYGLRYLTLDTILGNHFAGIDSLNLWSDIDLEL